MMSIRSCPNIMRAGFDETASPTGATVSDMFSYYWNHPDSGSANTIHDTVVKALENLKYTDVNTPAFLLEDVVDLAKMAYTIGSYVRRPGKAVQNVKRLKNFLRRKGGKVGKAQKVLRKTADAYLNYRFGLPLTVSDIKEMVRDYHRHSRRTAKTWGNQKFFSGRAHATLTSQQFPDTKFCCKIYVKQYDEKWAALLQYLWRTNLYLSAENTWDLIPFSFVVDWIIPVNKLMKYVDINTYDRALPVVSVLYSLKCVRPTDGVGFKASHLSLATSTKYYIRWSEGQLPEILQSVPSLSLNVDKNIMLHTIDATALAIQHSMLPRLKR